MRNKSVGLKQITTRVDVVRRFTDLDPWLWSVTYEDERTNTFYFYNHLNNVKVLDFFINRFKDECDVNQVELVSLRKKGNLTYTASLFIEGWPHEVILEIKVLDEK